MSTVEAHRAEAPLILSLDIGTSAVRALLFDHLGRAVQGMTVRRSFEIHTTHDGAAEVDPDAMLDCVWWCIDDLLERAGTLRAEIEGVVACTFVSNVLGVDETGRAATPLVTYADTRSTDQVAQLREELDEDAVHQRTGCVFHTSYLPAQLRWFAHRWPDVFERAVRWMSIGEYMETQLFPSAGSEGGGETAVSYSVASWTGLLDRRRLVWDAPLLNALPVTVDQLSPLTDSYTPRRGLRDRFAARWPALRDLPWFPAVSDGAAANLGSGCVTPDRVALTIGTTSAVRLMTDREVEQVPAGLWCYRVDSQHSLLGGALSEGGSVFAWMQRTLRLPSDSDLGNSLANMEPDEHGLTVLPFLTGERSPGWVGDARATLHGISLATTPLDIVRASLESVAYRIALVFDRLEPLLPADFEVVASGGALRSSPVWVQVVSDVLGQPVVMSEAQEASARGAALLALKALNTLSKLSDVPRFIAESIVPDCRWYGRYRRAIERQQMLYQRLVEDRRAQAD